MLKRSVSIAASLFAIATAGSVMAQQPLVMERQLIRDRSGMAFNQDAGTFLKPSGWNVSGGVKWYPKYAYLVSFEIKVANPNGLEQVEMLPAYYFIWSTDKIVPRVPGEYAAGATLMPPVEDPKEVIRTITLPQLRGPDARIMGSQEMPEIAKEILKGIPFPPTFRTSDPSFLRISILPSDKTGWMGCGNGMTSAGTRSGGLSIPAPRGYRA